MKGLAFEARRWRWRRLAARATARRAFRCCDTTWNVLVAGPRPEAKALEAEAAARALEAKLNAFDASSAVARLNRDGRVEDAHVARIVRRGLEYLERTAGAFDVRHGRVENAVKRHIRGAPLERVAFEPAAVSVHEDVVETTAPLDLNGLAKGYIVDRVAETLRSGRHRGLVDGGGDIATPVGPVAVEDASRPGRRIALLDTDWNVATSSGLQRRRGDVQHIYDPRSGRLAASHDQVTVVARRDCMEADALATTLALLPTPEALALVDRWDGVETMIVQGGEIVTSRGWMEHAWRP